MNITDFKEESCPVDRITHGVMLGRSNPGGSLTVTDFVRWWWCVWEDMPSAGVEQQDGRPSLNHHDLKHLFYILSYCGSVLYIKINQSCKV